VLNIKEISTKHHPAMRANDTGLRELIMIVIFKGEEAGREVIEVNPRYPSHDCSRCSHKASTQGIERVYRISQNGFPLIKL
jgi:transposase